MRALTVIQPYASWIATGEKPLEWRRWATRHRGPLLICAGKTIVEGYEEMPRGVAVCIVDLVGCRPYRPQRDADAACLPVDEGPQDGHAWLLANPRPVEPFPVRGMPGLFSIEVPE